MAHHLLALQVFHVAHAHIGTQRHFQNGQIGKADLNPVGKQSTISLHLQALGLLLRRQDAGADFLQRA